MIYKTSVRTKTADYEVAIGNNILESYLKDTLDRFAADTLYVLIGQNVHHHHGMELKKLLSGFTKQLHMYVIPAGESSKSMNQFERINDFLLQNGIRRNTPLIVIGGGVTGDLGGFAASTVLRGVPLIHIPTTLLAMVDSSVGGKTGINHHTGKNLIGTFYQPEAVISDIRFLQTLPAEEWINGLSEILKYAAIHDINLFNESEMFLNDDLQHADPEKLIGIIGKCVDIKAYIVGKDEHESGIRAFLNFGHTFAHALEKACDYHKMSHGEAVYLGMHAAIKLSELTGFKFKNDYLAPFRTLYHYKISKTDLSADELLNYMYSDKKRTDAHLRFVLLKNWQDPHILSVKKSEYVIEALSVIFRELELNQLKHRKPLSD